MFIYVPTYVDFRCNYNKKDFDNWDEEMSVIGLSGPYWERPKSNGGLI